MYFEEVDTLNLTVSDGDENMALEAAWNTAIKHIHNKGGFTDEMMVEQPVMGVIRETSRILNNATARGTLNYEVPQEMTDMLTQNVFKFSGFKSYHELAHASTLLRDERGDIKPFSLFKNEVLNVHQTYNVNYLRTEYNFALSAAQAAGQWAEIAADGDEYNLQYRTAHDERVRYSHAAINDTTLPPSDPFWAQYYPPNGWNCRCKAVRVRKSKYQVSDSKESIDRGERATTQIGKNGMNKAAMFRFNPGVSQTIFPDKHPYYKVSREAKQAVGEAVKKVVEYADFDSAIDAAKTKKSVETQLQEQLGKEHEGIKVSLQKVNLYTAKQYAKELNSLCSTYKIDAQFKEFNTAPRRGSYGMVRTIMSGKGIKTMSVGQDVSIDRLSAIATSKSLCDTDKLQVSTLNHEFGHLLWQNGVAHQIAFTKKAEALHSEYHAALKANVSNKDGFEKIFIGNYGSQPKYSRGSIDEFVAEGFQEYRNKSNPSEYAVKIGGLIDGFYKK